jgi:Double zinc ribbon
LTFPQLDKPSEPRTVEIRYVEDGNIKSAVIDPWSTTLGNGEVQLWNYGSKTKGFFRPKVVESMVVTNFRIMGIDHQKNIVDFLVFIPTIDDVIVMNTRRVSQSTGYGISTGSYVRTGQRFSSGTSKTIGDIVFIVNTQKYSWLGIPDPTGLKNFIKSIKRSLYDPLTKLETKSSRAGIPCPGCGLQNPKSSKFCNNCGKSLASICSKCRTSNPINSSFCSKCGSQLGINNSVSVSDNRPTLSDEEHSEVIEPTFNECILPEFKVKINYPSTWIRRDDTPPGAMKVLFQSPKESPTDQLQDGLSINVDETFGNITPQYFIEENIKNNRQNFSDFTLFESTPTTLSGLPAHQMVYLADNLKTLVVASVRNNVFYWLQYVSEPKSYQKFLSSVEQMISSFEFL